ncbi:MAG TPA: hypothetical protein VEJ85_04910 [Thermoplasmata archaeon]|nr:hypothetical protein [Thermoplasmata archaeon]
MRSHQYSRYVLGAVGFWAMTIAIVTSVLPLASLEGSPTSPSPAVASVAEVNAPASSLQVTTFTITPNPVVQGNSFNATAIVTGGQPPYTYSWSNAPSPCNPGNVSSWKCQPNNPGQFNINLQVTDVGRNTTQDSRSLSVVSPLSANGIIVGPNPVYKGSQFSVSIGVNGGVSPYTFDWTTVPPGCSAGNVSSWQCSESQTGNFSISVSVRDLSGQQVNRQSFVNVTSSGGGNGGNGNGNGNGSGKGSNSNGNSSNGLNLSGLGSFFFYAVIAGIVSFALLVALTVGVIMIAVILARRLPRPPKNGVACGTCGATAPPGSKFCPACGGSLGPAK